MSAGVLALVALLLWLAAAPVITFVVERQLRSTGYAVPSVVGVSLAFPDVVIDRLQLDPAGAFVVDGIRARIGTKGIESIAAAGLRLTAAVSPDGAIELPGLEQTDEGPPPLDLLPNQGVHVAEADIRLGTPVGEAEISLTDIVLQKRPEGAELEADYVIVYAAAALRGAATAELGGDGAIQARFRVGDGRIAAGGVRATGLVGEVVASRMPRGSSVITADFASSGTSLAGVALGRLGLEADWRNGIAQFTLASAEPEAVSVSVDGRADLTAGSLSASLSGRILLDDNEGQLVFDAELTRAAGGGTGVSGPLRLTGSGLIAPGVLQQGSVELAAVVEGDTDRLRLTATDAWTAAFTPDAALLPEGMQALVGEEVSIALAPRADGPLALHLAFAESTAQLEADVHVAAGESRLSAQADITATWRPEVAVSAAGLKVTADDLRWGSLIVGVDGFEGEATYSADGWRLDGAGAFEAAGSLAAAAFEGLTTGWSGTVSGTPESVVVTAAECVEWAVAAIELGEIRLEQLSPPCIRPGDGDVLLVHDFDQERERFAVSMTQAPLEIRRAGAGAETTISGTWPALRISGVTDADGIETLTVDAAGGALTLPAERVAVEGVDGSAEIRESEIVAFSLAAAAIESRATPPVWAPVGLLANGTAEDGGLAFEASISDPLGILVLEATGEYDDGRGASEVTLYPIQFISGATEVGDLSPALAEHVADASGTVGFEGEIRWGPDGVESAGDLSLREFGATVSGTPVAGINATTSFNSLLPPATLPNQRLEIGQIDLGVPLENGIAVYALDADGQVAVRQLEFDLAGGRVYAEPFTVDSARMGDSRFVLRADEVELSQVLVLSRIEGLQGTGVLSGRVPVRISDRGLQLDEGVLAAQTDGFLRYTPADLPDFLQGDDVRSRMLREALTNFQYDELSVSVASEPGAGGEQRLTLSAKGANPDFLEGHPIELNFNFRGPLLGAMRSAVSVSGAGEIENMFEEQERNDVETTQ